MEISQSSIKLYKRCPQAYYYKKVELLQPKLSAAPLYRGTILHSALEAYYNKESWKDAILEYQDDWDNLMEEEKELYGGDLLNDCIQIMEGYCRTYGKKCKEKILAVELDLTENPVEILPNIFIKGRIDLISEDDKGVWLTEHKSAKKIPSEDSRFLNMQTVIYQEVAERLGYKIDGIRWNYLRTKTPTVPRVLVKGGLSIAKNIDTDYYTYMKAIEDNNLDPNDYTEILEMVKDNEFYVRRYTPKNKQVTKAILQDVRTIVPIIERLAKYPYRNLDPFNCRGCAYKSICQAELLGLDSSFILKKDYVREEVKENEYYEEEVD